MSVKEHVFRYIALEISDAAQARAAEAGEKVQDLERQLADQQLVLEQLISDAVTRRLADTSLPPRYMSAPTATALSRTTEAQIAVNEGTSEVTFKLPGEEFSKAHWLHHDLGAARRQRDEYAEAAVRYRSQSSLSFELTAEDVHYFGLDKEDT